MISFGSQGTDSRFQVGYIYRIPNKDVHNETRTKNVHKERSMTKRTSMKTSLVTKFQEKQVIAIAI